MEPFIGQIQAFGFNFAPRGWAKCDGQLLSIAQNTALFSLLGTMFGGDGRTSFGIPDLRGRSIVHIGQGLGLDTITQGEKAGSVQTNISINNLPSHNHGVSVSVNNGAGEESNATSYLSDHAGGFHDAPTPNSVLAGVNQNNVGANQPLNTRNPFLGVNVCIALQGIFPSRS